MKIHEPHARAEVVWTVCDSGPVRGDLQVAGHIRAAVDEVMLLMAEVFAKVDYRPQPSRRRIKSSLSTATRSSTITSLTVSPASHSIISCT